VTLWQWLTRGARPREAPSLLESTVYDEASRRLTLAVESTRVETRRLESDASELADRIRDNARKGRKAFGGDP
jgi:hypothetical protein